MLRPGAPLMGLPNGKSVEFNSVSQNRLIPLQNQEL